MHEIFIKGGPIMWPLLLVSLLALTVVIERLVFISREQAKRQPQIVEEILASVERSDIACAIEKGKKSEDFVARTLVYALQHNEHSFSNALLHAANQELKRYSRGLPALDTIITLAPLLGLLGTVTRMIHAFGL